MIYGCVIRAASALKPDQIDGEGHSRSLAPP
jgi:hypothetical protein